MHPSLLADASGSRRLAPPRPWIPTVPSPPSNCCNTSLCALKSRTQLPRKSAGFQGMAHTTANRPAGVGVLGFPTTTLMVRIGAPSLYRVSVRRAVETSMRHRVFAMATLSALTQPDASSGRQGSQTCTQQRPWAARGREQVIKRDPVVVRDREAEADGLPDSAGNARRRRSGDGRKVVKVREVERGDSRAPDIPHLTDPRCRDEPGVFGVGVPVRLLRRFRRF